MSKSKGLRPFTRAAEPQEMSLADFGKQLNQAKTELENQQMKLNLLSESFTAMEEFFNVNLNKASLAEMETFYKEKLQNERCARVEAEEELKSFKDRVAEEVGLTLKTGNSESMNDPVNETRLKEMYEELWKQWHEIKPHLHSLYKNPDGVRAQIQKQFQQAAHDMMGKRSHLEMAFKLTRSSSQKVIEYTKLSIQNLQLAVNHCRKEAAAQKEETLNGVIKNFLSKCYWLGCLLVLNSFPLQPDWRHHDPGLDSWNIFPQNITAAPSM